MVDIGFTAATSPPVRPSRNTVEKNDAPERGIFQQLLGLGRLKPYLWPKGNIGFKVRSLIALTLTIASQFVIVGAPFMLGRAIDQVDVAADAGFVGQLTLLMVGLVLGYGGLRLLATLLSEGREYIFAPVAQSSQRAVATATFAHMHKLSLRYHLEKRTGKLNRIIERGVKSIDFLFRFLLFNIGPTFLQLGIVGVTFAAVYDWRFALIAIFIVVTYVAFTVITTEWRLKFRREMNRQDNEAAAKAVDSLLNYETVKYFAAEEFETSRYDVAMGGYMRAAIRSRTSLSTVNIGQSLLMNIGLIAVVLLAANGVLAREMVIGDITAIVLVMSQLYRPLNILGFAYREIKQALTDLENMFALMDRRPEIEDTPGAKDIGSVTGRVEFEDVHFHYDPDREILKGINFTIEPGQTVAIVGPTGAGKSTLSRILFRFYDIASGAVRIDGQDLITLTQSSVRKALGIVPQDTVLFNDTIGYNIGYAKPGASQSEIEQAAKDAQVHDFIEGLPKGYDTVVGERGLKLSGGEKQRVAIARTLLKNPAILILDEATSALDSATERDIQTALDRIAAHRTTLVIAHRLSTIVGADQILVMEDGKIRERGTHEDLVKIDGLYAHLWAQQENESLTN